MHYDVMYVHLIRFKDICLKSREYCPQALLITSSHSKNVNNFLYSAFQQFEKFGRKTSVKFASCVLRYL